METINLNNALEEVGKLISDKLRDKASSQGFEYTGNLKNSFTYEALGNELRLFGAKYANALSEGIKTGSQGKNEEFKQLQSNIIKWAKHKGIRPRDKKGRFSKNWKSLGFVLARSIRQKGISKRFGYKGSGFISTVKKEMESTITDIIFQGYKKDLEEQLNNITNNK